MIAFGACDASEPRNVPVRRARPTTTPEIKVAPRRGPRVAIESQGRTQALLRRAVRDLKAVGMWKRLTGHLYRVELDSRAGSNNVPADGHLADAYYTGVIDQGGGGRMCDVMFFPSAIAIDLARWRSYYGAGLLAERPPSMRGFYGSLLAHELAHCSVGPRGEAVARSWEDRARAALLQRGI